MANLIVILIVLGLVGLGIRSLVKQKKAGNPCIGCSYSGSCGGDCKDKAERGKKK